MTATTPGLARVRDIAHMALEKPEGLTIRFETVQYNSLRDASMAARSFQTAFASLRATERRKALVKADKQFEPSDTNFKGPFDTLSCSKRALPNDEGFAIALVPGTAMDFATQIIDNATGEPLKLFSPDERRADGLYNFLLKKADWKVLPESPWTIEEEEWVFSYAPDVAQGLYDSFGLKRRNASQDVASSQDDLANLPLDVDPFTGERIFPGNEELGVDGTIPTE